jgi:methyltransferase family protein
MERLLDKATFDYLAKNMDLVEGWFERADALGMLAALRIQQAEGVAGGLAEIGVHHGKSFLLLALGARPDETIHALDVFDQQHLNTDQSGSGDEAIFLSNVQRFAPTAKVNVIKMSSTDRRVRKQLGRLRFLSIDGGHTRELTKNDLRVADAVLTDKGMCCVDDIMNFHWTGVITGVFDYLHTFRPGLWPFAIFPKKLFFCRRRFVQQRKEQFRAALGAACAYTAKKFGDYFVDVYGDAWDAINQASQL